MIPLFYLFGICWLVVAMYDVVALFPAAMCFIVATLSHMEILR